MDVVTLIQGILAFFAVLALLGILFYFFAKTFELQQKKDLPEIRFFEAATRYYNLVTRNYPNGCHYDPLACADCLKVEECKEIDADLKEEE